LVSPLKFSKHDIWPIDEYNKKHLHDQYQILKLQIDFDLLVENLLRDSMNLSNNNRYLNKICTTSQECCTLECRCESVYPVSLELNYWHCLYYMKIILAKPTVLKFQRSI